MKDQLTRAALWFLAGAASCTITAYLAGGGMRAGLILGAAVVLVALLTWPRAAARGLNALADGVAAFRYRIAGSGEPSSRKTPTESKTHLVASPAVAMGSRVGRQLQLTKTPAAAFTPIQSDVVSAMVNLGMGREQARRRVLAAGDAADFETLFRKVQAAA
jgi:hypothetical protein